MSNNFMAAFLSEIDIVTARQLYIKEQPATATFHLIIDQLSDQRACDKLAILLTLLNENSTIDDCIRLKSKILLQLALDALSHSNKTKAEQTLNELKVLLTNDALSFWQESLPKLVLWIETHHQNEDILFLLQHLPSIQRERLYSRLLETADGNPSWLAPLITYVVSNFHTPSSLVTEVQRHLGKLASSLLLSPTLCHEKIGYLSLALTTEELVNITFQLRAIAATYATDSREKQHQRFIERRQTYLNKYDALATALTVRATNSNAEYELLVHGNNELANILMIKRLKLQITPNIQRELVTELLEKHSQYDLQDPLFKAAATESFLNVFSNLPLDSLSLYFKKFYSHYANKNLAETIRFLDLLFEKSRDKTKILRCLDDIDDGDKTVTINFITTSRARDDDLTTACLERLDEKQLINLYGHIIALRSLIQYQIESLPSSYYQVLSKKIRASSTPTQHFADLAEIIKLMSEEIINDTIKNIFRNFNDNVNLRYQWLNALFNAKVNITSLLGSCQDLLKTVKLPEQVALLKPLSSEEILALYLHMLSHNAATEDFHCFVELLKDSDRQPLLLYLLLNTPIVNKSFLDQLVPFIDDKNLITLIIQLLDKVNDDNNYTGTLEELLQYFCQRLQSTTDEKASLHQWIDCEDAKKLASHLLESPICFYALASRSSLFQDFTPNLLQGYLVNNASADLRLRANRVLNLVPFDTTKIENIALGVLSHFHSSPKKLQTLFINLESAQQSLDEQGKKNFTCLKQACCKLLKSTSEDYEEKLCTTLLTTQLTTTHCFDSFLAKLASNISQSKDAHLSAQYLTQIETNALEQIPPPALATILTKSIQETTKSNWQKVAIHLKEQNITRSVQLVRKLIAQISNCNNNPVLFEQALQFIVNLENIDELIPFLKEEELQWLIKESRDKGLHEKFPHWFKLLLSQIKFEDLNYCSLFALLPPDQCLLDTMYQFDELKPHAATIFLQLAKRATAPVHFIALFQQLVKESSQQKRQFIIQIQEHLQVSTLTPAALFVLNMLLLTLDDLHTDTRVDRNLVLDHLQLIAALTHQQMSSNEHCGFSHELQQLMINTLSYMIEQDNRWSNTILTSQEFANIALAWLEKVDNKALDRHPLTKILLQNTSIPLPPTLTSDKRYQGFVKQLLTAPPQTMNEDQFSIFFETLTPENQKGLALDLLQRPTLGDVQWSSLMTLARVLPTNTLYNIYSQSKTRFVFVDLLARHPNGMTALNNFEQNMLIAEITSGKQVLRILDSYSPAHAKVTFVEAIFNYLDEKKIPLLSWLESMNVDTQTLAAFANYTTQEKRQLQLRKVIQESHFLNRRVNEYLQTPTLEMFLEPKGLLFSLLGEAALNPWQGWLCQFQLMQTLEPYTLRKAIPVQFELLEQVSQLNNFLEPLSQSQEVACSMLQSARWIQRLPLLFGGVLAIIYEYQNSNTEFQKAVEQTKLYQLLVLPLLSNKYSISLAETQLNHLYNLLIDYHQAFQDTYPTHAQRIFTYLKDYQHRLKTMEHFAPPKLVQLFIPDSYFGRIKNGQTRPLQEIETELLSTAAKKHQEWLAYKQFSPALQLSNLLTALLKTPKVFEKVEFRKWFLEYCLFSPLAGSLKSELLIQLLSQFPNNEFTEQITQIHSKLKQFHVAYETLKQLATVSSLPEVMRFLYSQSIEVLRLQLNAAMFAHQPHLTNLLFMALQAKRTQLPWQKIQALLPPKELTNYLEVDWIHLELGKLSAVESELALRHQELMVLGFSAFNDTQNLTRLTNLSHSIVKENIDSTVVILNSYLRFLSTTKSDSICIKLFHLLNELYFDTKKTYVLFRKITDELLNRIIVLALQEPKKYEELLQKIIYAGFGEKCQTLMNTEFDTLGKITDKTNNSVPFLEKLSLEQFAQLTPEECEKILILQRLSFNIKPLEELTTWNVAEEQQENYSYFCADASLYETLFCLQQQLTKSNLRSEIIDSAQQNLDYCLNFLSVEAKMLSYNSLMDKFHQDINIQKPGTYYHWLCLLSFLAEDKNILITHFLNWLTQLDDKELTNCSFLDKLLAHILDKDLLVELCQNISHTSSITPAKSTWLFERIVRAKSITKEAIENIVLGFSWDWLKEQIKSSTMNRLNLLELALQQKNHIKAITVNTSSKLAFFTLLNECQLSANELIHLQKIISNQAIKSMIIAHLLGRKDYIEKLQGESFLTNLITAEKRLSPRLQPLVFQLHLDSLSPEVFKQLQPEAAASLFCSIKNFHRFDETYVESLLLLMGEQSDCLIKYWLSYYGTMPNSATPLVALLKLAPQKVLASLAEISEDKRRHLLNILIKNLDKLTLVDAKNLLGLCHESHLVYAAHLYLYEGISEDVSIQFINELTEKILEQKVSLTSQTIHLLMRLSERAAFSALRKKLGRATSDHLRSSALFADCSIFYDEGHLNLKRMQKLVPLQINQADQTGAENQRGFVQIFTKTLKKMLVGEESAPIQLNDLAVNPLIAVLAKDTEKLPSIDYFLIHYHGKTESLQRCINDYFDYLAARCLTERNKKPYSTTWLLTRSEVAQSTRKTIFDSLLTHPELFDERICGGMLLFDAEQAVAHFGLQGDYPNLITLCSGLPFLDENSDTAKMVERARKEAEFESTMATISGFLAEFRIWFRRSLFYGWETWLQPRNPQYVIPCDVAKAENSSTLILQELTTVNVSQEIPPTREASQESLENLLTHIDATTDLPSLTLLANALNIFEWQKPSKAEIQTRETVDNLFEGLLRRAKGEYNFATWLPQHVEPFITNRRQLIGLYNQTDQQEKLANLLSIAIEGPGNFKELATLLLETKEPELVTEKVDPILLPQQPSYSLMGTITGTFSSITSFFWRTDANAPQETQATANPAPNKGWFNLFSR